jgi:hypothetical protein
MVEIIEYALVFAVTVSLSVFSVLILGGAAPVLDHSQSTAEADEISGAASLAALRGNATIVVPLSDASLACSQGVLAVSSGGSSYTTALGYPCNFRFSGVTCLCTLNFVQSDEGLGLRVTG